MQDSKRVRICGLRGMELTTNSLTLGFLNVNDQLQTLANLPLGKRIGCNLKAVTSVLRRRLGCLGKWNLLSFSGIETRFLCSPARSLRLSCPGGYFFLTLWIIFFSCLNYAISAFKPKSNMKLHDVPVYFYTSTTHLLTDSAPTR